MATDWSKKWWEAQNDKSLSASERKEKQDYYHQQKVNEMAGTGATYNPGNGSWSKPTRPSNSGGSSNTGNGQLHTSEISAPKRPGKPLYHNADTGENFYNPQDYAASVEAEAKRKAEEEAARKEEERRRKEEEQRRMIEEMNRIKRENAMRAIRGAYDKNMAEFDRARMDIAPGFQDARNQAAAQSEIAKRRFGEFAAASGLNSGVSGQAELNRQNALQNNLSGLAQREAGALADLDLKKTQATTDMNNAIAKAEADGNYELAQQLYEQSVRNDAIARQEAQQAIQNQLAQDRFDFQKQTTAWEQERDAYLRAQQEAQRQQELAWRQGQFNYQKEQDALAQQNRENGIALELAKQYAKNTGDYSVLEKYGYPAFQNYPGTVAPTPAPQNLPYDLNQTPKYQEYTTPPANPAPAPSRAEKDYDTNVYNLGGVTALGIGPISRPQLDQLVQEGKVLMQTDPSGRLTFTWAPGYGPTNWQTQPNPFKPFF